MPENNDDGSDSFNKHWNKYTSNHDIYFKIIPPIETLNPVISKMLR